MHILYPEINETSISNRRRIIFLWKFIFSNESVFVHVDLPHLTFTMKTKKTEEENKGLTSCMWDLLGNKIILEYVNLL